MIFMMQKEKTVKEEGPETCFGLADFFLSSTQGHMMSRKINKKNILQLLKSR